MVRSVILSGLSSCYTTCSVLNVKSAIGSHPLPIYSPSDQPPSPRTSLLSSTVDAIFERYNAVLPRVYVLCCQYAANVATLTEAACPVSLVLPGAAGFRVPFCVLIRKVSPGSLCLSFCFWLLCATMARNGGAMSTSVLSAWMSVHTLSYHRARCTFRISSHQHRILPTIIQFRSPRR